MYTIGDGGDHFLLRPTSLLLEPGLFDRRFSRMYSSRAALSCHDGLKATTAENSFSVWYCAWISAEMDGSLHTDWLQGLRQYCRFNIGKLKLKDHTADHETVCTYCLAIPTTACGRRQPLHTWYKGHDAGAFSNVIPVLNDHHEYKDR